MNWPTLSTVFLFGCAMGAPLPEDGDAGSDARDEKHASPPVQAMDASACANDISNAANFRITFQLTATQKNTTAVVNQRSVCDNVMFWDVRLTEGVLQFEMGDGSDHLVAFGPTQVADGKPHAIRIESINYQVSVAVDGTKGNPVTSSVSLGKLPPISMGTDVCEGVDGTVALTGSLTNVCANAM